MRIILALIVLCTAILAAQAESLSEQQPPIDADLISDDSSPYPQIELSTEPDWDVAKIGDTLTLLVDDLEHRISPTALPMDSQSDGRRRWRFELPRELRAGINVELRFRLGAEAVVGEQFLDPKRNPKRRLLVWFVPFYVDVQVGCSSNRWRPSSTAGELDASVMARPGSSARCRPNSNPRLYFRSFPSVDMLRAIARDLPEPLRLSADGPRAARSQNRGRTVPHYIDRPTPYHRYYDGFYIEIEGAEPGRRYQMDVGSDWVDIFGTPFKPITLVWQSASVE